MTPAILLMLEIREDEPFPPPSIGGLSCIRVITYMWNQLLTWFAHLVGNLTLDSSSFGLPEYSQNL